MSLPDAETIHEPVLVDEVLAWLITSPDGWYLDGTVGTGGHTAAILSKLSPEGRVLGLDLDPQVLAVAGKRLSGMSDRAVLRQGSHGELPALLDGLPVKAFQGVLLDLGLSSFSLQGSGRGFSFQVDEPLDMRYDPAQGRPLHELLPGFGPRALADILSRYGEERRAGRIAEAIHREAAAGRMTTSSSLATTVRSAARGPHVTKTLARVFQALRIHVNDELRTLGAALAQLADLLNSGGRVVIISYHSLEDRLVKQFFARESKDCICPPKQPQCSCEHTATLNVLTRKPVIPSADEQARNRRSRSAKLRVAESL